MCDYSLHSVANRPAKVGDRLVSTKFVNSTTRGFIEPGEPRVAVCLRPGTEIAFEEDVKVDTVARMLLGFNPLMKGQRLARFRQINMTTPDTHHDALEFPNGKVVLVTQLVEGQTATVLQLPATAKLPEETQQSAPAVSTARRDPNVPVAAEVAAVE